MPQTQRLQLHGAGPLYRPTVEMEGKHFMNIEQRRSSFHQSRYQNNSYATRYTLGSKGGAVVRALASRRSGAGSNPGVDAICGLSLLLFLSLAPRGFSPRTPVFPSPQKPTFPNSNSTRNQVDEEPLCGCATCKSLFIYLFYLFRRKLECRLS